MIPRWALLLLGLALLARAEVVVTKDGQRLVGEVLEESRDELVLRTRYGVLVLPTAAIAVTTARRLTWASGGANSHKTDVPDYVNRRSPSSRRGPRS